MDVAEFQERLRSLRETRARLPELVRNRHAARRRRSVTGHGGRLLLVEADDPARGRLGSEQDPRALFDRGDLLRRLFEALRTGGLDGIIGTADLLDDLLLLEALEDRIALGAMNSGGVFGSAFEHGGAFTGFDPDVLAGSHLDGGKMRLPIDPLDPGTAQVLESAGHAVTGLAGHGLLALIEAEWVVRGSGGADVDTSADALARAIDVASGLGGRSPYSWLLLPAVDDVEEALAATTLPAMIRIAEVPAPGEADLWPHLLSLSGIRGMVIPALRLHAEGPAIVDRASAMVGDAAEQAWQSESR